jgi:hypothetical protein
MKLARTLVRYFVPSRAMVRLATYFCCVSLAVSALAARTLYADGREAALSAGHSLIGFADLTRETESVVVNGVPFHHVSVTTDQPLAALLDRFEAHCEENPNFVGRELSQVRDEQFKAASVPPPSKANRHGVIRSEEGNRGMLVCFVDTDPEKAGVSFVKRMERFAETQDLSEFGAMRYAYGEQKDGKTHLVILWADTGMNVKAMFPSSGDAAGTDSRVVPRPPGGRRILSGEATQMPYAVHVYESNRSRKEVRAFYDKWMADRGWIGTDAQAEAGRVFFDPSGYQVYLGVGERDGASVVSLVEAGRANGESTASVEVGVDE